MNVILRAQMVQTSRFLLGVDVNGQVDQTVGVSPFVIIPRDNLVEVVVQGHASTSVNNGTALVMKNILGNNGIIGVSENTLEVSFGGFLQGSLDVVTTAWLFGTDSQVDQGNVRGGDADSHTGQLAVEFRDDLTDSLGSSSTGRDKVVQGTTSSTPVLSSLGGSVDNQLVGGSSVDGGHKTLDNAKLVMNDLGHGSKTVGSTGSVGKNFSSGVGSVVDSHHIHGGVRRRSRDDDPLCSSLDVKTSLGDILKDTSGLANSLSTDSSPWDLSRISAGEELDLGSSNVEAVTFDGYITWVGSVDGIVLELVGSVVNVKEGVIDSNDGGIWVVKSSTAHKATDTSKSVDSKAKRHDESTVE
mmetsp:Transcript_27690/g.67390  ORF Transcript_27690/g.67390 Transcript_27690/m.67390 type:complete len:357 (-) Transcript_27690:112-1182(-)